MDIELKLREILPLHDPGAGFTDDVMSRLGDAPVWQAGDSVVRLADAQARRRSRRILLGTVVAIAAAASMPAWYLSDRAAPVVQEAVAAPADGSSADDPPVQMQVAIEPSADSPSPQECVDPDVLRGLLLGVPDQTFQISDVAPPELAGFKAPRQLTWVGSAERGTGTAVQGSPVRLSAVYRTNLAPAAARSAAAGALTAGGWKLQGDQRLLLVGMTVFTSANSPLAGETYCREGKPMGITASALDGVTYVVLSASRYPDSAAGPTTACNQPPQAVGRPGSTLNQYMPTLELPRDPATGQQVSMRGGGGSNGAAKLRTSASFTLKDSPENVARHFARQMTEQGWSSDTGWSGAGTAGSTWTRRQDDNTLLQGTLSVSAFEDGRFSVIFTAVTTK